ncbi:unnamed protein product [Diamesa serratosioi]
MSGKRQDSVMDDLGVISGSANIPFADDDFNGGYVVVSNNDLMSADSTSSSESYRDKGDNNNKKASIVDRRSVNLKVQIESNDDSSNESSDSSEKKDRFGPLKGSPILQRGLRRNSISLPALNEVDLDALRSLHMQATDTSETDISKESIPQSPVSTQTFLLETTAFRTKRRHSIAPLPAIRLNDKEMIANEFDTQSVLSMAHSTTSVGSLASLLKEKMQAVPSMIRRRKKPPKDFKIRAFVGILFFVIVFLVGYAYIMYNQKIMSTLYFEKIKFTSSKRLLNVFDAKGNDVLSGNLGPTLNIEKANKCLLENELNDGSVCWQWSSIARMYLNADDSLIPSEGASSVKCYKVKWESLDDNYNPINCFNTGDEHGQWYGGGLTNNADWPLERASFKFSPFITGDGLKHQWGNAVKRYFLNSKGVAIEIDEETPLYIGMNEDYKSQFCLKAQNDDFAFFNKLTKRPVLKYRICTGDDMKILHHSLTQKSLWDGLKEQDINIIHTMLEEPVWQMEKHNLTSVGITNYTENVIALGFFRLGHVLINENWQQKPGDFELDQERFSGLEDTINMLHRRGFKISLTVQPFVSTESKTFAELVEKKLLIFERSTERSIPALTQFKNSLSDGVLDVTNDKTIPWLNQKLDQIVQKYQVDSFYLDFGVSYDMPRFYQCSQTLLNPDYYKTLFTTMMNGAQNLIGVSGAVTVPRPPAFLSLPKVNSSWRGLQTILTSVLSYGIIGYPFLMPGAVGGDYTIDESQSNNSIKYIENPPLPEKELYIRWLQLATFLPVLRFTILPSDYRDEAVMEAAKELTAVRQKTVMPLLKKYLSDAMNEGLPLIRPLWMIDPLDAACLNVDDEFSVGDELIVAPIFKKGQLLRDVYLPHGVWKDGIDGSLRKGSRSIHDYRVPEDKIAYFVKMPDNTRF